ncbi:MAG TPA: tetratricopeptide repeat protein [Lacibacter sp.]|nr:tetratricopeptide repeat protein [Lacibacter sp.]HMO90103.1 tetratricopeptide repeat protein [Lacibacter sp.]HMP87097.1 tetratricopeptide repeat protein [Lacibacter sp.]
MVRFFLPLLVFLLPLLSNWTPAAAQPPGSKGSSENEEPVVAAGTTYALVIGISLYDAPRIRLNAADKDAALYARFLQETPKVEPRNLLLLLNRDANSHAVNQAVRQFKTLPLKKGDEVIIYFSGHGDIQLSTDTSTKGYVGYLLCSDVNVDRAYTGAQGTLSFRDLNDAVEHLTGNGVQVSIILDACHSGQTINEQGADLLSEGALSSFRNTIRYLSCGANQRSYENKELGHGFFTYYLVKGLLGEADNSPADNKIRVNELNLYVYNQVLQESQERQEPTINAPSGGKVVMQVAPEMKALTFQRLQENALQQIVAVNVKGKSLANGTDAPWLSPLTVAQQALLEQLNTKIATADWQGAVDLQQQWTKKKQLPADWLRHTKLRLTQQLGSDPQQAVNTILLGKNNLPPAHYFKAAADKSYLLLQLLDTADYGYRVYAIYARYLEAYSYLRSRNFRQYERAKSLLHEALRLEPDAAFVLQALGRVAEYQNDYPLAEQYYRRAIELIPTWTYPRSSLGNVLRDQNRYREATEVFEEVIRLAPQFSWPYNNLANVYYDLKRYREAERLYRYSIEIDTVDVAVEYSNLGLVYRDRGNIREAENYFRQSMAADSQFVYTYHHLAELYKKVNARVTTELLERSVELEPFYSSTLTELADYYREGPNAVLWQKADSLYRLAISNNPYDPWAYAGRAWLLAKQKDSTGALQLFREAVRVNPGKPAAWTNLGRYYQNSRRYPEALEHYRKSLSISPFYWTAYQWMHETYLRQRKADSAVWILQQARVYFEENPDVYNLLGNYYYTSGLYDSAAVYYNYTLQADSNYALAYSNLAYTELELNRFSEAVRYFQKAHATDPLLHSMKQIAVALMDRSDNLLLARKPAAAGELLHAAVGWIEYKQFGFYIKASTLYYLNGKPAAAIPLLQRMLADSSLTDSFRYRVLQLLGWCYLDGGDVKDAFARFEQSLRYSPNPSYLGMAAVRLVQQQPSAAKEWLEKENKSNSNWKDAGRWRTNYSAATQLLLQQLKEW